ncbi:MAG: radical SAM protein [Xanthobacteraceae bacterium]
MGPRAFRIALIKPSHYDDNGYVVQWRRSYIPSNSLASVYALIKDCAQAHVLGSDVAIDIEACDECNTTVNVRAIAKRIRAAGGGMVGLVGVQSNQFPRALDLGRQFRALRIPVVMGGFHVSGCLAMLPGIPPEMQEALDLGIHLFAGEAEGRMADVLRDVATGSAKPIYNYLDDMPDLSSAVPPILPSNLVRLVLTEYSSFDAGRGCPFQCSFCTIINVQGRKSRYRSADDVEAIVRANAAQGVTRFFVTDDNFARNRNWEAILDRLIELREREKFRIKLILQVDTLCHRILNFIEKSARAGATFVFIGLENINPESLLGTKKRQNKIWEYREMLLAWRRHRVITYAGYILGFPTDTPESIARDIDIIKKELPIDILEFFCLTPLPGSEDHKKLHAAGVDLDPDLNKYDLEHACTDHPRMTRQKWTEVYKDAFARYYTDEHVEKIMRRAVASRLQTSKLVSLLAIFSGAVRIEGVHPLQFGLVRRKSRTQRRSSMPMVNPLLFYPWRAFDFSSVFWQWLTLYLRYYRVMKRIKKDPASKNYVDEALRLPAASDEADKIVELFADKIPQTHGAPVRAAVGRQAM